MAGIESVPSASGRLSVLLSVKTRYGCAADCAPSAVRVRCSFRTSVTALPFASEPTSTGAILSVSAPPVVGIASAVIVYVWPATTSESPRRTHVLGGNDLTENGVAVEVPAERVPLAAIVSVSPSSSRSMATTGPELLTSVHELEPVSNPAFGVRVRSWREPRAVTCATISPRASASAEGDEITEIGRPSVVSQSITRWPDT